MIRNVAVRFAIPASAREPPLLIALYSVGSERQGSVSMLTVVQPEQRIRADHPIRRSIKALPGELRRLSPVFTEMDAVRGRPSIPPERLLKACLRQENVHCAHVVTLHAGEKASLEQELAIVRHERASP